MTDQPSCLAKTRFIRTHAGRDLIILALVTVCVLVFSYFFDVFAYLVEYVQKNPQAILFVDEVTTGLLTVSVGFAVFSWRRWRELKKETAERLRLQDEILNIVKTEAEAERIICRQLHSEIDLRKEMEKRAFPFKSKK
jgi:hypothetical protein